MKSNHLFQTTCKFSGGCHSCNDLIFQHTMYFSMVCWILDMLIEDTIKVLQSLCGWTYLVSVAITLKSMFKPDWFTENQARSCQVNRTQKNMEQDKKHTDFDHTLDGRNEASASASWGWPSLSHYLRGFSHIHCWRISSITSIYMIGSLTVILGSGRFPYYCRVDLLASATCEARFWDMKPRCIRTMKTKSQVRPIDCHLLLTRPMDIMDARVVYQFDSICWSNINGCWYGINIKLIKNDETFGHVILPVSFCCRDFFPRWVSMGKPIAPSCSKT